MKRIMRLIGHLRVQMTVLIMLLVFLACFALALIAGSMTRNELKKQAEQDTEALLGQVIRNVGYYLDDMEALSKVVNEHYSVMRMLLNTDSTADALSTYYEDAKSVRSFLTDLSRLRSEIMSITIAGENGSFVSTKDPNYTIDQLSENDIVWYRLALSNEGRSLYLPPHEISNFAGKTQYVISLVKPLSLGNAPPSGAMSIDLTLETLKRICSEVSLGDDGYIYIIDGNGNIIYHPNSAYLSTGVLSPGQADMDISSKVLGGEQSFILGSNFVVNEHIEQSDYYVIGVVPYGSIIAAADSQRTAQTLIGLVFSFVIAIIVAVLLSRSVFRPLNDLKEAMNKARGGDMSAAAVEVPHNEIGELGAGFNAMIERIRALIQSNAQKEKEKRKAELDALQAQINPHFLYNTLDSIVWMAHYQPDIAASMADSLAKLFRLMLGGGEDFVPLRQEIEHVSQYLSIQKLRYASKFSYKVVVEEGLGDIRVPKLILQPLVENAIYHGIKPTRKTCRLAVCAVRDKDLLTLFVGDDGVGMSETYASAVLHGDVHGEKPMGGIGVKNINERIALHYGEGYGVSYCCAPDVGTVAIVVLPAQ